MSGDSQAASFGADDPSAQRFTVDESEAGQRLDACLAKRFPQLSRGALADAIEQGRVSVEGVAAGKLKRAFKLSAGMAVSIALPSTGSRTLAGNPELQAELLHEDEAIAVFSKPAGMAVHPQKFDATDTLANLLIAKYGAALPLADEAGLMPGIAHRLDAGTSGVIVCARTQAALDELKRQFREREVEKHYIAIVETEHRKIVDELTIDSPIERDPSRGQAMRINKEKGRQAVTRFTLREKLDGFAVLDVYPQTGRTHQIRVHLASRGWPVAADHLYSGANRLTLSDAMRGETPVRGDRVLLDRHALHALSITLTHPLSGERVTYEAEMPDDMEGTLMALRIHRQLGS